MAEPVAEPMAQPAVPRPAATVVLLRPAGSGLEVLLTQRPSTMAFAPNVHAFPGGAVDPGDSDTELLRRSPLTPAEAGRRLGGVTATDAMAPPDPMALHTAAIRELFEEAGVLLAAPLGSWPSSAAVEEARTSLLADRVSFGEVCRRLGIVPAVDRLAPLSRWVTPRFVSRRFDTWFFAAMLPPDVEPAFAESEVAAHRWMTPAAALDAASHGEIELWPPTSATLQQLEHVGSFADVVERLGPGPSSPIRLVDEARGLTRVVLPGAGGVPGQSVNAYVVGYRDLVIVDPGDPSEEALDALIDSCRGRGGVVRAVAVTHGDPDHHGGVSALATTLDVPICASPVAARVFPFQAASLPDGEPVPFGDVELRAIATPGHRPDHVSLLSSGGWVLAGDVVGPGPSRSILGAPDIAAWRSSLDRLKRLRPAGLFPGHGEPSPDAASAIAEARHRLAAG